MTTPPKDAPVTEAGRRLLAFLPNEDAGWYGNLAAILAIEAEAATAARSDEIDALLYHGDGDSCPGLDCLNTNEDTGEHPTPHPSDWWDGWSAAWVLLRGESSAYAHLRSEQGERTPRVDPEIDAT